MQNMLSAVDFSEEGALQWFSVGWLRTSGRSMSGTPGRFPRYFFRLRFFQGNEGEEGGLGLEVPDVLLPDILDHPIQTRERSYMGLLRSTS